MPIDCAEGKKGRMRARKDGYHNRLFVDLQSIGERVTRPTCCNRAFRLRVERVWDHAVWPLYCVIRANTDSTVAAVTLRNRLRHQHESEAKAQQMATTKPSLLTFLLNTANLDRHIWHSGFSANGNIRGGVHD
jgi:hypothetical protein